MSLEPIQIRSEVQYNKKAIFGDKFVYTREYDMGASISVKFNISSPIDLQYCDSIVPSLVRKDNNSSIKATITAVFEKLSNKIEITITRDKAGTEGAYIVGYTLVFILNSTTIDHNTINTNTIVAEKINSPVINTEEITNPNNYIIEANVKQANDYNKEEGNIKEAFDEILQSSIKGGSKKAKGTLADNRKVLKWYMGDNVTTPIIGCVHGQITGNLYSVQASTQTICIVAPIELDSNEVPIPIPITFADTECEAFLTFKNNYLTLMIYRATKYGSQDAADIVQFSESQSETKMMVTLLYK